uniref:Cell death-related nuclease 6 n=1 Tax=Magallana gigas TaxID=29159 RepID=K1PWH3_MAGGI
MKQLFLIIGFLGYHSYTHSAINCKSPSGKAVDWFILYKLPRFRNDKVRTTGNEFFYMDEDNQCFKRTRARDISRRALAFDKNTGFWIISSIPRFPAKADGGYIFADQQLPYGQIALCVTVLQSEKNQIVGREQATTSMRKHFKTKKGNSVEVFAKSASFGKDIYDDLISPGLNDKIHVQTWRPDLANTNKVWNIDYIDFGNGISYKASLDHSKWAVAKHQPFTCIGDINRQRTQFKRGGLSLCLENENVAESFRNLYSEIEKKKLPRKTCPESAFPPAGRANAPVTGVGVVACEARPLVRRWGRTFENGTTKDAG